MLSSAKCVNEFILTIYQMQFKIKTMEISFNLQEPSLPQVLQDSQNFKFLRKNITTYRKITLSVARALWKFGITIAKSY